MSTEGIQDSLGVLSAGNKLHTAGRAIKGATATSTVGKHIDTASNLLKLTSMHDVADGTKTIVDNAKTLSSSTHLSKFATAANYLGKAAPVLAKASVVLGGAIGAYEIGSGINSLAKGDTKKGKEKLVDGVADTITAGAGVLALTGVGLPLALGIGGAAQLGKYAYKYSDKIADGAKWVGGKISDGAKALGNSAIPPDTANSL